MKCRIAGHLEHSLVNGPGIRFVLFMQGCTHHCRGCQNPGTWDPSAGVETDTEKLKEKIRGTKLIDGITLSGGDPVLQAEASAEIASFAKSMGLSVWCYTGWTFENLLCEKAGEVECLLGNVDVLVDGPFIESLKSDKCLYRGSTNQRLVDVRKTLASEDVVEWEPKGGLLI